MNCPPSKVAAYRTIRPPTCQGGAGCAACWAKYNEAVRRADKAEDLRQEIQNRGDC